MSRGANRETYLMEQSILDQPMEESYIDIIENFKATHDPKINLKIEPILNTVITQPNFNDNLKNLLIESINNNVLIYYYMQIDILTKLIYYLTSLKDLSTLIELLSNNKKIPKSLYIPYQQPTKKTVGEKGSVELYDLRYRSTLLRYCNFLLNQLSR